MVGAKLACIEGATTPGVTGYTPQYHKPLYWIFQPQIKTYAAQHPPHNKRRTIMFS